MQENLEGKWRVHDLEVMRSKAESVGALFQWTRAQRDVFFAVPRGRLKMRLVEGEPAELIAYFRPDGAEMRVSRYLVARLPEWSAVLEALLATVGQLVEVQKRRTLLTWRNVRVHLDEVGGLGRFLELESVVTQEWPRKLAEANFRLLAGKLDLESCEAVSQSYADLLLRNGGVTS